MTQVGRGDLDAQAGLRLSSAQERMWFLQMMDPGSAAYNVISAARLGGVLNLDALHTAVQTLLARHDMLRSVFRADSGGQPRRHVRRELSVPAELIELPRLPGAATAVTIRKVLSEWSRRPFDLTTGPLARFAVIRLSSVDQILAIGLHHTSWTAGRLACCTESCARGTPPPSPGGHQTCRRCQ